MEQSATEVEETTMHIQTDTQANNELQNSYFPHDAQTDHWDVDFSDSKQVYEGMALPLWLLAGWAMFIIWAVLYLTAGVRTTF